MPGLKSPFEKGPEGAFNPIHFRRRAAAAVFAYILQFDNGVFELAAADYLPIWVLQNLNKPFETSRKYQS